jgi:hypothetical protein
MKPASTRDTIKSRAGKVIDADRRLFKNYRGQHVAYIDLWQKSRKTKTGIRLVRKILSHGDVLEFEQIKAKVPARLRSRVVFRYLEDFPPNTIRM